MTEKRDPYAPLEEMVPNRKTILRATMSHTRSIEVYLADCGNPNCPVGNNHMLTFIDDHLDGATKNGDNLKLEYESDGFTLKELPTDVTLAAIIADLQTAESRLQSLGHRIEQLVNEKSVPKQERVEHMMTFAKVKSTISMIKGHIDRLHMGLEQVLADDISRFS